MTNANENIRELLIEEQAAEIEKLQSRIAEWRELHSTSDAMAQTFRKALQNVMEQIAIDISIPRTHRERNEVLRLLVRDIYWQLNRPTKDFKPDSVSADIDDIPF